MKKKIKAIVLMLVCVFALAACGNGEQERMVEDPHATFDYQVVAASFLISRQDAYISGLMSQLLQDDIMLQNNSNYISEADKLLVLQGLLSKPLTRETMADKSLFTEDEYDYLSDLLQDKIGLLVDSRVFFSGACSYGDAKEMLGTNSLETIQGDIYEVVPTDSIEYDVKAHEVVAQVKFKTEDPNGHDGIIEIIFDKNHHITSITVNTVLTMGESMERAGVNTLIGMGSVFIMLIVIAIIISLLKFVPMIMDGLKGKPVEKTEESLDKTIAGIVEREEAQEIVEDDTELVAVIAAAIAASEGAASTEGFVVRSIRRVR
ncbi:MAG: OadG family protein [Lachnospiraceae bacterium]|nr:OadG family protein [Lachnospiraceae bacterium]